MRSSIKQKLTIIYIVLILIPLLVINYLSVENLRRSVFREAEVNALKTANIIAHLSRNNFQDTVTLKRLVREYAPALGGRILILNGEKRVLADSFTILEDEIVDNVEVRGALRFQERIGYYQRDKYILQVAVPVVLTQGGTRTSLGAVLVSLSVNRQFEQVQDFRRQLLGVSLGASLIGIVAAVVASGRMARPIEKLSRAAQRIGEGNLGEEVSIQSKDEIGRLAGDFNQMSRALYRMDRSRTQFIGDVSHELRTPLASMKALIDSLLYGEDDIEVYKEYLGDMDSEIDRLSKLVQSLLALAKLEERGLNLEKISLQDVVEGGVKVVKPLLERDSFQMKVNMASHPPLLADEERLKEVVINLLANAIQYRDQEKKENWIWIEGIQERGKYFLKVRDNGIGIHTKDLEAIFEKFYRSDLSRSRETGGAGIGLSIVSRIIKLHGWSIGVESNQGEGTTFTIEIPKESFRPSS